MGEIILINALFCCSKSGWELQYLGCREPVVGLGAGCWGVGGREGGRLGVGEALVPQWELPSSRPSPSPAAATFIAKAGNCLLLN